MEKKVLFICESAESFLVSTMIKNIKAAGYEVIYSSPNLRKITKISELPNLIVVYLDGDDTKYQETLEYLAKIKNSGANLSTHVFLIGNPIEIETAYRIIPKSYVSGVFERPVNTSDLVTKLGISVSGYSLSEDITGVEPGFKGGEVQDRKRVLIVDDDTTFLRSMRTEMAKKFNVYITNSGMNAVSFLKERPVDLILLDYEMPVVSGLEVFRILRSEEATVDIPVIFLTSKDDKNIVMKVLEVHPVNYLLKPIAPTILVKTVEEYFEKEAEGKLKNAMKQEEHPDAPAEMEMIDETFSL
ncbi:MAG: response regulator [Treponema sp.]|nr:response regulator [Treponema sp.]MBQ5385386.1 response regulator [Treponema sp.]